MNLHIINVIIGREYSTRVKKKSFLVTTFVVPILFAALCIIPSVIMVATKEESKKIAVIDKSEIVLPYLNDSKTVAYSDYSQFEADSVKNSLRQLGLDGLLVVSALDSASKSVKPVTYSSKPLGMDLLKDMETSVNDALENFRIGSYGIENLSQIVSDVKSDVTVETFTLDEKGNETISASEVYMMVSMALGLIIYTFIGIFSGMVMSSVIEEKSSRVVEVLMSSVKSTELLFGKIIGVAMVALTQFLLWVLLTIILVTAAGTFIGADMLSSGAMAMQDPALGTALPDTSNMSEIGLIFTTLGSLNFPLIIFSFIFYFVFGFLLYASLFAAIGSAGESAEDTQQLQMPVTIPLLIAFLISIYAFKAPDSSVTFWGSMIPFTSPIVMLSRIPYGVPVWELALSMALLVGTFFVCAWVSAKIYNVGVLMYGKKSTLKDLWKWLRQ